MIRLAHEAVDRALRRALAHQGVAAESIEHVVASLVQTSLRAVDSHGVNLFPHYHRAVAAGRVNPTPTFRIDRTHGALARLDADHGFGHHAGAAAMDLAIELAREHGVGAVSVADSTHFGAAAYFGLRAADRGLLGFAFTNADALVRVSGSPGAFFGTNPICFTAPLRDEGPLCLDMATSRVSWNKVASSRQTGAPLEPGWASTAEGAPTTDAVAARTLEAIGDYKGYGLGLMVEVLCGVLAGGPIGHELLPMYTSPIEARRRISHFFMALDASKLVGADGLRARLQHMVDDLRRLPSTVTHGVQVPGDPEKRARRERETAGLAVLEARFEELVRIAPELRDAVVR